MYDNKEIEKMNKEILDIYKRIESLSSSKILVYVTSDRANSSFSIKQDAIDIFEDHLEKMGTTNKITLILHTLGGDTMATWNLVNLIREYCNELEIIVPKKARSAGTIMCLGANKIVLTHQSTLGPIDPSLTSPLGIKIQINGIQKNIPTSVESVKGYFNFAKNELGIKNQKNLTNAFIKMSETINPLLIGDVYRSQAQIKMIAKNLLKFQNIAFLKKRKIVNFLCSASGSHDYTINYTEAKTLGLNVELANEELNLLINRWYKLISEEMLLRTPYNPMLELANQNIVDYEQKRAIVDSIAFGRNLFIAKGTLSKTQLSTPTGPIYQLNDTRKFEGWIKDDNNEK